MSKHIAITEQNVSVSVITSLVFNWVKSLGKFIDWYKVTRWPSFGFWFV